MDQQPQSILVMPAPPPTYDEAVQGTPNAIVQVPDEEAGEVDALSGHPNVPGQNAGEAVVPHAPIYVPDTYNYAYYATPFTTNGHVIHKAWDAGK
ncbi:hypothetical protein AAVH_07570 [Aphelenchoides avenae]|nr:hypothetical protein AAVH_07570 [Aphelenchus avenae]